MERREISELHEEIATMQTLYQYRTYSVDSSEDSDVEEDNNQVIRQPSSPESNDLSDYYIHYLSVSATDAFAFFLINLAYIIHLYNSNISCYSKCICAAHRIYRVLFL